jgi:hypothetical protein
MDDTIPAPSPFQSSLKLASTCNSPEVDSTLYCQLVGSLLYLTHTRFDISFVIGIFAWYMQKSHEIHWKETKRILRYVWGIVQLGIHYNSRGNHLLVDFIDSNWACKKQHASSLSS